MSDFETVLHDLLKLLTFPDAQVSLTESAEEVNLIITVPEDATGMLIGFHGEKLDALQLILTLVYNRGREDFIPLRLDINDYRQRRSVTLNELADKAASQAVESGREIILPPLSPSERRLVHLHLADRSDVDTYSEGEGRTRRLIIRPQVKTGL